MYKEDEVFNSEILNAEVDISFGNCHENSLHDSFQDQFDNVQGNVQFKHPSYSKQMIEFFEGCHVLYDPVADHMDKFFSWSSWLCVFSKDQIRDHCFFPL